MDKILKALTKLIPKDRVSIETILRQIKNGSFDDLDIKKLKGHKNIYRVRTKKFRIIYKIENDKISILSLEKRSDNSYKNL